MVWVLAPHEPLAWVEGQPSDGLERLAQQVVVEASDEHEDSAQGQLLEQALAEVRHVAPALFGGQDEASYAAPAWVEVAPLHETSVWVKVLFWEQLEREETFVSTATAATAQQEEAVVLSPRPNA